MSDLFVGEILVLSLLLPVLLRPFFRRLQRIEGISLLPLVSFLLALLVLAASGLRITLIPVLILGFLVLCTGLIRLFHLFSGLPTDWYSPASSVWLGFLLLAYVSVFFLVLLCAPVPQRIPTVSISRKTTTEVFSTGCSARITVWSGNGTASKGVVLLAGDISSGAGGRNTTATILAESGYTVLEADFRNPQDYENPLLSVPALRKLMALAGRLLTGFPFLTGADEIVTVHGAELDRMVSYARTRFGPGAKLFAIAEGSMSVPVARRTGMESGPFSGSICIVPESDSGLIPVPSAGSVVVSTESGALPPDSGTVPLLVLTAPPDYLYGYGEIAADDILGAVLFGGHRDDGRKRAELTARRIESWLALRSRHDFN